MAIEAENIIIRYTIEAGDAERDFRRLERRKDDLGKGSSFRVNADTSQAERRITGLGGSLRRVGDIAKGILTANLIQGLATGLASGVRQSFELATSFEQTRIAFNTFLKDTERTEEVLAQLNQFSLETPFAPEQVFQAGQALLAFGENADNLVPALGRIGDLAAGTGKDFNELAVIYGKARVAGTLFAEDINQLTEAGIPVIQEFAAQLGVSESEVKKLGSEGQITFANLEQAFIDLTSEGGRFQGLLIAQSQSVGGLISTLQGAGNALLRSFGEAVLPIAREILPPLIESLFSIVEVAQRASEPVANFFRALFRLSQQALTPVVEAFGRLRESLRSSTEEGSRFQPILDFIARTFVFLGNVAGTVIDGFTSLLGIFRSFAGGGLVQSFASAVGEIPAVLNGVGAALFAFSDAFSNSFDRILLSGAAFLEDLKTIFSVETLENILTGNFDAIDFSSGDLLRKQRGQIEGFGSTIGKAFKKGFDEIDKVTFEIPETEQRQINQTATMSGETAGREFAKGVASGSKKQLAEGSLAALQKDLSELEKAVTQIGDISNLDGAGLSNLQEQLQGIAKLKGQIEGVKNLIEDLSTVDEIETLDTPIVESLDKVDDKVNEVRDSIKKLTTPDDNEGSTFFQRLAEDAGEAAEAALEAARNLTSQLIEQFVERKDAEIAIQEERLNDARELASRGNAEQLQLEEERLRTLQEQRERAVRTQRQLAAVEIASANAVAAAESIKAIAKAFGSGNIAQGVLTSITLAATIASTIATLSNAFGDIPAFRTGTDRFIPGQSKVESDGGLAILHKDEMVVEKPISDKLRRQGVSRKDLPELVTAGLAFQKLQMGSIPKGVKIGQQTASNDGLIRELKGIRKENKQLLLAFQNSGMELNIDQRGIHALVKRRNSKLERKDTLKK